MEIRKTAALGIAPQGVTEEDLKAINRLSRGQLKEEDVYTFSVRLCDNEVDRDYECFDSEALQDLGQLFVGKTGIFDHQWSALGQTARLYRTEVVSEEGTTRSGQPCKYLKGWAYMLRTEKNRDLIAEIEGGIKQEVSIGCSVSRRVCSICGEVDCSHQPGRSYGGKLCYMTLMQPTDAYEWSFVAVPAQRKAGVIKNFGGDLRKALSGNGDCLKALDALEAQARLGRSYLSSLRKDVVRMAGLVEGELDLDVISRAAEKLEEDELLELKKVWQHRLDQEIAPLPQLRHRDQDQEASAADEAFLI